MFIPLVSDLVTRGPITALGILVSVAVFNAGAFFVAIRNTAIDCEEGSATHAACGVDGMTSVVTAIGATGSIAAAIYIGLVTPTPRDALPIFRIDGVDVNWNEHVNYQRHGLNRTIDNPAVIEWQLNHTMPVWKYITYAKDGYLIKRHDSGVDVPHPDGKRGTCRAYYDTKVVEDDLRSWEYASTPGNAVWGDIAEDLFYEFANQEWNAGCVWFKGNQESDGTFEASFELGASCSENEPAVLNCGTATYTRELASFNF